MQTLAIISNLLLLVRVSQTLARFQCRAEHVDDEANCYRVSTILAHPYVIEVNSNLSAPGYKTPDGMKHGGVRARPDPQFEGFLVDYLDELARLADFKYHLRLVKDGKYGYPEGNPNNILATSTWNGLVGEIITNETDIALAPLTVTPEREQVVDFTMPFEHFQAVVVYWKRPSSEVTDATSIRSVEDLVRLGEDNVYRYGVRQNGNLHNYLKQFRGDSIKARMSSYLDKNPVQPKTNEAGLARVQQDLSYAFLVEEPSVRAALRQPPCLLQSVPAKFYRRSYALAVRKCSPLRERLNAAIMELADAGTLDKMAVKWWGEDYCGGRGLTLVGADVLVRCFVVAVVAYLFVSY